MQELCARVTESEESSEAVRAKVGHPFRILKAHLQFREGEIPRDQEEPLSAVRQLHAGELIPAPQTAGGEEGVVSLQAACVADSDEVANNTDKFPAAADLEFLPPSRLVVAQRFPKPTLNSNYLAARFCHCTVEFGSAGSK